MVLWSLPFISNAAEGKLPFDLRPFGYTVEEARALLTVLSNEGREFYLTVQHKLDSIYPALVCAVLVIPLWHNSRAWSTGWRVLLITFPIVGAASDYFENFAIADLLVATEITDEMIETASRWTVLKSMATTFAVTSLIGLLIWSLYQRHTQRKLSE